MNPKSKLPVRVPRSRSKSVARRTVAIGGAASLAGLTCSLFIGTKEALAEATRTGRPVLTDKNLNALLARRSKRDGGRAVAKEMRENLTNFIRRNFALTAMQRKDLDVIPPDKLREIDAALSVIESEGGTMSAAFRLVASGGSEIGLHIAEKDIVWARTPANVTKKPGLSLPKKALSPQ